MLMSDIFYKPNGRTMHVGVCVCFGNAFFGFATQIQNPMYEIYTYTHALFMFLESGRAHTHNTLEKCAEIVLVAKAQ